MTAGRRAETKMASAKQSRGSGIFMSFVRVSQSNQSDQVQVGAGVGGPLETG